MNRERGAGVKVRDAEANREKTARDRKRPKTETEILWKISR
jgi:hypothetical protein